MRRGIFTGGRGTPLGAIGPGGDSVDFGSVDNLGGWRAFVEAVLLLRPGFSFVGPYNFGGSPGMVWEQHYAKPGQTAEEALTANGGIAANVTLYGMDCLTMGWGINDVFHGKTAVEVVSFCDQIITDARAGNPAIKLVQRSLVCQGCSFASVTADVNVGLAALAAARGVVFCNVGTPPTSDTKHPTQPGYAMMANNYVAAIDTAFAA